MQQIFTKTSLLVLCTAAGMKYDINFGVRVPVGELIAFISLPFLLQSIRWERYQAPLLSVIAVLVAWVIAVCLSDFVNSIPLNYFVRGLAKPIWCGLWMFFFIGVLTHDYRSLYAYPAGLVIAGLQNHFFPQAWTKYYVNAGEYEAAAFAIVPLIMPMVLSLSLYTYRRMPLMAAVVYLIGSVVFAYFGAPRSTVALSLLVFMTLTYMWSLRFRRVQVKEIPIGRVFLFFLLSVIASYVIFEIYLWIASSGWMGEMQQRKLEAQSDTIFGNSFLGLILDGRTSVFAAILAIIDHPFLGFGSWQAKTLLDYYFEAFSIVGTNADEYRGFSLSGTLPGAEHSILFSAWVENGILAAVSIMIIGYWMLMEFLNIIFKNNPFTPLFISTALFFFWSYFFSPFGVESRLAIGLFLALKVTGFCKYPPSVKAIRDHEYLKTNFKYSSTFIQQRKVYFLMP